jgi:hypothetical protein
MEDASWSSSVFGCPELALAEVKLPFTNRSPMQIEQMIDDAFNAIVEGLTGKITDDALRTRPAWDHLHLVADEELSYEGEDLLEAFDLMQDEFIRHGWSDGMPLIPPTPAKVEPLIAATGKAASDVVGIFDPGRGIGTVAKIAANAAMAGVQPSAMPIVMAMVDCMLDPAMGLRTWSMSTGPQAPLVMVSGPITQSAGMNHGVCALGPGSVSSVNVAIGRALRLIMMNVGHCYPGISDMDTIGSSSKFSACVAENEAANPWVPFRVSQGFASEQSTVTLNVPYGVCELFDFYNSDPEALVESYATVSRTVAASPHPANWLVKNSAELSAGYPFSGAFHNIILMCPEHAQAFADAGWSARDVVRELHKQSRLPFGEAMINKPMALFHAAHPELGFLADSPELPVSLYPTPDYFQVFVVGGDAGRSLFFHGGTVSVTKPIHT